MQHTFCAFLCRHCVVVVVLVALLFHDRGQSLNKGSTVVFYKRQMPPKRLSHQPGLRTTPYLPAQYEELRSEAKQETA